MPIKLSTNNRILPGNSRAVDVSRATLDRIMPTQIRRYHNAFMVQGNQCVVYNRLNNGVKCACKSKVNAVRTRLSEEGKASPELINELLTGGHEFGILDYGSQVADAPNSRERPSNVAYRIVDETLNKPVQLLNRSDNPETGPMVGSSLDVWDDDPNNPNAGTVIADGIGPNGAVGMDDDLEELITGEDRFDQLGLGLRDCACPICFGTGFVGGFQVFNGWRRVLTFQWENANLFDSIINYEEDVPSVTGDRAEFSVQFPMGVQLIDALKVWNYNQIVPAQIVVDGTPLANDTELLRYFDGQFHTVLIVLYERQNWTHVEIQAGQSHEIAYLDFPKMTKGSVQAKIEAFQDIQLVVSPLVPLVRSLDVVADSTYSKIFQIKDSTWWNDKNWTILGWECNARPCQPQELYAMLPKRRPINSANRPRQVTTTLGNAV